MQVISTQRLPPQKLEAKLTPQNCYPSPFLLEQEKRIRLDASKSFHGIPILQHKATDKNVEMQAE
jgi:hypothetical protein